MEEIFVKFKELSPIVKLVLPSGECRTQPVA